MSAMRRTRLTSTKSVSMPVNSSRRSTQSSETALSICRSDALVGNIACWPAGQIVPKMLGPVRLKSLSLSVCGASPQLESENHETMTTKFKLILGGILLLFGIIFAMQNSTVVEVRFLVWSVQMSQALVIFLTGAVGTIIGFLFGTAFKISRQS